MVLEDFPGAGIQLQVPLHALGIAQLDLIDIATVFVFQLGFFDARAWMLGQCRFIELFEGFDGPGITQTLGLIRAEITRLGNGSDAGEGGKCCEADQSFHGFLQQ